MKILYNKLSAEYKFAKIFEVRLMGEGRRRNYVGAKI